MCSAAGWPRLGHRDSSGRVLCLPVPTWGRDKLSQASGWECSLSAPAENWEGPTTMAVFTAVTLSSLPPLDNGNLEVPLEGGPPPTMVSEGLPNRPETETPYSSCPIILEAGLNTPF